MWGYYFVAGVALLARNRTAGWTLVEAHPASVFSSCSNCWLHARKSVCAALVRICWLHASRSASSPSSVSSAHVDVLRGGLLGWVSRTRSEFMSMPRYVVGNEFVENVGCFDFRHCGMERDAASKVSRYGGAAPAL